MEIRVHQVIIHELIKAADAAEATLFLTERALPLDERSALLAERLDRTFSQKEDLLHGYFSPPEDALFPGAFQVLAEQDFSEAAFLAFSRETMHALQLTLQGVIGAKGGYLVYTDYQLFEQRMIGIFLVRDTEGLIFRRAGEAARFEVDTIAYLDIDKLAMACRINVDKFREGRERYLEVIKHARSQKEISEYFLTWIALDRPESSRAMTTTFLDVVEHLPLPVDQSTGTPMAENEFRREVFAFAMTNPQKTIKVDDFDAHFYGEGQQTQAYLQEHRIELDNEFRFDRGLLKQLYHFRASADGISLGFNRDHLAAGQVRIEEERIVIHSPELVRRLTEMDKL